MIFSLANSPLPSLSLSLFLSLTLSPLLLLLLPDLILSPPFCSTHSCPHFSFCYIQCVLRLTLLLYLHVPPFLRGEIHFFCHPIKALIYCIFTNGEFNYLHAAFSFCLCFSFSHFPFSSPYIHYPLWVQKIDQQQTVVAPRWRLCQSEKN